VLSPRSLCLDRTERNLFLQSFWTWVERTRNNEGYKRVLVHFLNCLRPRAVGWKTRLIMPYQLHTYVWATYQIGEISCLFADICCVLALLCHPNMEFSRMHWSISMPIEEEVHLIRDLLKIGNWIVNILHRHFLRVGVAVLLTRKSLVELPWLLLSLDFYAWCVRVGVYWFGVRF
jgi:hypothetical protein